jgi:protein tyrosine phosphatase (PTP) superfamily phosphohydrolase (DUF442 family)
MNRTRMLPFLMILAAGCRRADDTPLLTTAQAPTGDWPGLHNVLPVTDKLLSGSSPDNDDGFRSLQVLGVRTIISVDGSKPDVESARRFGLRYVHLPIGYDGVPREQALRIAKAVRDLPGKVYIHCHHGQHRGPAAAAVARLCLDESCPVEAAVDLMRRAGADPHYAGLYASARDLRRPSPDELDRIPDNFPEVAPVPALAGQMVAIDNRWDELKTVKAAGWRTPPGHADLDPPHEALQLRELFREAARLPDVARRPEDFRRRLSEAESAAKELELVLRGAKVDLSAADRHFTRIAATCKECHAKYRD